jgi:gluconolactonase
MKFATLHASLACATLLSAWHGANAADAPPAVTATPAIAGVVNAGTAIQLVKDGFEAVEGPMRDTDGSVLFTNNQAGRILRAAADDQISTWLEGPFGANALTRTPKGEIVATLQKSLAIGVLQPGAEPKVLADKYDGKPFNRPNDLVADRRGNIYFTDSIPVGSTAPVVLPSSVYQLAPDGKLILVTTNIPRPNGVGCWW